MPHRITNAGENTPNLQNISFNWRFKISTWPNHKCGGRTSNLLKINSFNWRFKISTWPPYHGGGRYFKPSKNFKFLDDSVPDNTGQRQALKDY